MNPLCDITCVLVYYLIFHKHSTNVFSYIIYHARTNVSSRTYGLNYSLCGGSCSLIYYYLCNLVFMFCYCNTVVLYPNRAMKRTSIMTLALCLYTTFINHTLLYAIDIATSVE